MFKAVLLEGFHTIEQESVYIPVQLKVKGPIRICGPRVRSFGGCVSCKRRKKKCDEAFPVCGSCHERRVECEWRPYARKNRKLHEPTLVQDDLRKLTTSVGGPISLDDIDVAAQMEGNMRDSIGFDATSVAVIRENKLDQTLNFANSVSGGSTVTHSDASGVSSPASFSLSSILNAHIKNSGATFGRTYMSFRSLDCLRFYFEIYSSMMCIGLESLNYFRSTFLNLASENEEILHALTAWGGYYQELSRPNQNFSVAEAHLQLAAKAFVLHCGAELTPKKDEQLIVLLTFYLILIGIEICNGDVYNWSGYFNQCVRLIQAHGGLSRVIETYRYSNDIKWIISYFQFRDVLSSGTLISGTRFRIEEYEAALPSAESYGIDPLQGIAGPIYNIFGEIANTKVCLQKRWKDIMECPNTNAADSSGSRLQYYEEAERAWIELQTKIYHCCPQVTHTLALKEHSQELDLHFRLFDLHILVCKMHLSSSIMNILPSSYQQQLLLLKALSFIDDLLETRMKVSLSLLLLICGVNCVTDKDRSEMMRRFKRHRQQYRVGNLVRIKQIVQDVWEMNPHGDKCIDWAELMASKGWNVYLG